jgi:hypothetical protein
MDGIVKFTNPDGSSYIGELRKSLKHGKGILTQPDGSILKGMF